MRFEPKTYTYYMTRMAQRIVARSDLTDLEVGGNVHTIISAVARELDDLSFQTVNLQKIFDIDTAENEDLDARGQDFNPDKLVRLGASYATGSLTFGRTGTTGSVAIAIGSIGRVPGGPEYRTTSAGSIANGDSSSGVIAAVAVIAGPDGNVDAGTVVQLNAIPGVETVTNTVAFTGGQDKETNTQFRERMKVYLRSLPRGTPDALKYAVLSTDLDGFGRIVTAEVVELTGANQGTTIIYVDDGSGTITLIEDNVGTPETVVATALGGEVRLQLLHKPVVPLLAFALELNASPLVENTDYTLNRATGLVTLDPVLYPSGLTAGDEVLCEYYWYAGLIAEAQKIVDGDPTDRDNYPGYRAAGTLVYVRPPAVMQQVVDGFVVVAPGFDPAIVRTQVQNAIIRYVNSLGINGDVVYTELVFAAQSIAGVTDIVFTNPTSNVVIGDGELARVDSTNVTIT